MASRSRRRYWHPWSQGNASRICCIVQSWLGCSVTWKCSTRRRACDNTTKTNRTRKVAVGTEKKVIGQEGTPSLGRRLCYSFESCCHDWLLFSLHRRPNPPLNGAHVSHEQFNFRCPLSHVVGKDIWPPSIVLLRSLT